MNSPNIQKIITAFLILAALTSSFVFLIANSLVGGGNPATGSAAPQKVSLDGKSAFVEQIPGLSDYNSPILARSNIDMPFGGNVTDYFSTQLSAGLIAANPNGPSLNSAGRAALNAPATLDKLDLTSLVPETFEVSADPRRIKTVKNYTADDILTYLQNNQTALQGTLLPNVSGLSTAAPTQDSLSAIMSAYDQTEAQIYGAKVPAPLAGYNSALLGFISVQRTFFDQTDPARALIAMKNPALVLNPYIQALNKQIGDVQKNLPAILAAADGNSKTSLTAAINRLLGIPTAYAFSDFIGGVSNIINAILKAVSNVYSAVTAFLANYQWVQKILTELLKNLLVAKLVSQVINWAQGGGKPQFVTNWKGFLGDAFDAASGGVIQQVAPGLCGYIKPFVSINLSPPVVTTDPTVNNPYQCTLTKVIDNIDAYGKSFQNGGWVAYGSLLQPQNNAFGAYIDLSDQQLFAGAAAAEASKNEAVSASGYKSQKDCQSERVTDNGYPVDIAQFKDDPDFLGPVTASCDSSGTHCSQLRFCDDYGVTTPGSVVDSTVKQNVGGSPLERIVNANDLTGLAQALINAGLNKLIAAGVKGLLSLTSEKLAQPGSLADTCNQYGSPSSTAYQTCVAQNGGISGAIGSRGSSKDLVLKKMKSIYDLKTQLWQAASNLVSKAQETQGYLEVASSTCATALASSTTVDAANTLGFISTNSATVDQKILDYQAIIKNLAGTNNPSDPPDIQNGMLQKLDGYIKLLEQDKLKDLATELNMTYPNTGDAQGDAESFFNNLSGDLENSGSTFGRLFGTLDTVSQDLSDAKSYIPTLTVSAGCGILEKARGLNESNIVSPTCSIAAVEAACKTTNQP